MSAFDERREQDVRKLKDLQAQSGERVRVTGTSGRPLSDIDVELHFKTAPSKQYPKVVQDVTRIRISLPARYPFVEPTVNIKTPILHPNVYDSGRICLGVKWLPSFGLDLLVKKIIQIVTFDPIILNEASPANGAALAWYRKARHAHPGAFPTNSLTLHTPEPAKKINWQNVEPKKSKVVISCPRCQKRLSVPTGKSGRVRCPNCNELFQLET